MLQIVKNRRIFFIFSICLIVLGILYACIFGVKLDVSFKGGSLLSYSFSNVNYKDSDIASIVQKATGYNCDVGTSQDFVTKKQQLTLAIGAKNGITSDQITALTKALNDKYGADSFKMESSNNVSATMGQQFLVRCMIGILIAAILIVIYVAIRFKIIGGWSAGVFGLVALAHDITIVFISFAVFGFALNSNFVAVILTIMGYSLNGVIVVYDRIRENQKLNTEKLSFAEVANKSINQSFKRTINTTMTTTIALVVMTVISYYYNLQSIRSFSLPLLVGVICGCYTSLCIAGPVWVSWHQFIQKRSETNFDYAKKTKKH